MFVDETFFKSVEYVIATRRAFYAHFMLHQNDVAPDRKSILLWVEIFSATGSALKRKFT